MNSRSRTRTGRRASRGRPPQRPAKPRFRFGPVLGILLAVLLAAVVAPMAGRTESAEQVAVESPLKAEVRSVLINLRGTWVPRTIERLGQAAEADQVIYQPVLAEFLASPQEPLFPQAVQLAVQQDQIELVPLLRAAIARADEQTAQLLVAAIDKLEPWPDDELGELLASDSTGIVVAALQIAGARPEPPLDRIAALLAHPTASIRTAALAATPAQLPPGAGTRVLAALRSAPDDLVGEALVALTRCPASSEIDAVLYTQLDRRSEHCGMVLDALARRGEPLARPEAIRSIALDEAGRIATRCRAFRCLEANGAPAVLGPLELTQLQHPMLELWAARALVLARRPQGIDMLLGIVRESQDPEAASEPRLVQEARLGARQLLAALADTGIHADVAEWVEWASQGPALQFESLPPSAIFFDDDPAGG